MQNLPYFSKIVSIWGPRCYKRSKIDFEHSCLSGFLVIGYRWSGRLSEWFWIDLGSLWPAFSIPVIVTTQIRRCTRHRVGDLTWVMLKNVKKWNFEFNDFQDSRIYSARLWLCPFDEKQHRWWTEINLPKRKSVANIDFQVSQTQNIIIFVFAHQAY